MAAIFKLFSLGAHYILHLQKSYKARFPLTTMQTATFGAGCFWHVEDAFRQLPGVKDAIVGYMGGTTKDPTYKEVCSKTTGHAEVCQVTFDEKKISYEKLVEAFWQMHDPTQVNRQGPDVGSQYRSVVFYYTPTQKQQTEKTIAALQKTLKERTVVTQLVPKQTFFSAEEYHQKYLQKQGKTSCHI